MRETAEQEQRVIVIDPSVPLRRGDVRKLEAAGLIVLRAAPGSVAMIAPLYVAATDPIARAALKTIRDDAYAATREAFGRNVCEALLSLPVEGERDA